MLFPTQTPLLVGFNLILIGIIFLLLYPAYFKNIATPKWQIYTAVFCIFLFSMFSFWGSDWFHYQNDFIKIKNYANTRTNIEDVYVYIIKNICANYFVFRVIVWGTGLLLFHLTLNQLELYPQLAWFFFGTLFLPVYAYARVSLAIAIMIYGAVLINKPFKHHKVISIILGVILIICSVFFHKSAIIGFTILILSFFLRDPKQYTWLLYLLIFIVFVTLSNFLIDIFLDAKIGDDVEIARKGQKYLNRGYDDLERGIGSIIKMTFERLPYYLTALLSYKILKEFYTSKGIHLMLKFQFLVVLFASLFIFDTGANTSIFYGRMLRFTIMPSAFILCYAHQHKLYPKLVLTIGAIAFLGNIYKITYAMYLSSLG